MKKIWFMMLMLCTACAFTACSEDDDAPVPTNPISNCIVPETAAIGSEVIVSGTGFKAATAQLSLKNEEGIETNVQNPTFTTAGATFTVPMSMTTGEYTLVLKQNGTWTLGIITLTPAPLPVQGLSVPSTLLTTSNAFVISGTGFNATSEIYLKNAEGNRIQLEIGDRSNGLSCTLPASIEEGMYTVILTQDGGEWILSEISIEVAMRLKNMTSIVDYSAFGMSTDETPWFLTYDEEGKLLMISYDEEGTMPLWTISHDGNQIKAIGNEDLLSDPYDFTFTVENGKVSHNQMIISPTRIREYDWTYNGNVLTKWNTEDLQWNEDNNLVKLGKYWDVKYLDPELKSKGIDMTQALSVLLGIENDYELACAAIMNLCGDISTNLPTEIIQEDEDDLVLEYEFNEKGYVTSVSTTIMGMFPIVINFTWE